MRSPLLRSAGAGAGRSGRRGARWALFAAGLLLSPLTPWNDAFLNIPLSAALMVPLARATGMDLVRSFAAAYALTNVLGLVLMGLAVLLGYRPPRPDRKKTRPVVTVLEPPTPTTSEPEEPRRAA
jgi:hypothetical protein